MVVIVGAAIGFRLITLFSVPIQEVDIYRYVWDGTVAAQGISPFQYTPDQVKTARWSGSGDDPELQRLVELCDRDPAVADILNQVHFAFLPTIYPSASQAVFWLAVRTTPHQATAHSRLVVMKAWLTGFDLGVLLVVVGLLNLCGLRPELCVVYAWCPLVIKEIANSGHLDSIAVFLATLAVYLTARVVCRKTPLESGRSPLPAWVGLTMAALVLGAAIGAKLYPVVLVPLFCSVAWRRFGWQNLLAPGIVFSVVTVALLWPLLPGSITGQTRPIDRSEINSSLPRLPIEIGDPDSLKRQQLAGRQVVASGTDSSLGLTTFLKQWEMNDFIFMNVIENLKPKSLFPGVNLGWFAVLPDATRQSVVETTAELFSIPIRQAPFFATRLITSLVFLAIALWLAWQAMRRPGVQEFCRAAFLTIAWFWLLSPTQNPWYWLWALPLLPLARSRAWLAVSGLVLLYYSRFWFLYHFQNTNVWGSPWQGGAFFDYVVTWIEYAPWFVWLSIESWRGATQPASETLTRSNSSR